MELFQYMIISIILLIIAIAITRSKRKDFKLEANKLISLLGGKGNILKFEFNKSRLIVELKEIDKVNKEGIQKLGAQGIVEIDNQIKIIVGEQADKLKKQIKEIEKHK